MKLFFKSSLLGVATIFLCGIPCIAHAYSGEYKYAGGADYDFWWVLVNQTNCIIKGNIKVSSSKSMNIQGNLDLYSLNPGETTPFPSSNNGFRGPWFSDDSNITTWQITIQDSSGHQNTTPWSNTVCKEGFDVHINDKNKSYDDPVKLTIKENGLYNYELIINMPASGNTCTIPFS